MGGAQPPQFANTVYHGFWVFEPVWHQKKSGGVGGEPPPFANTFVTGSERVHMGPVFAGAKILEVSLRGVGGGRSPHHLQTPFSQVLRGSIRVLSLLRG